MYSFCELKRKSTGVNDIINKGTLALVNLIISNQKIFLFELRKRTHIV